MAISNQAVWKWGGKHLLWVQVYGRPSLLGAHPEIFVLFGLFPDKLLESMFYYYISKYAKTRA